MISEAHSSGCRHIYTLRPFFLSTLAIFGTNCFSLSLWGSIANKQVLAGNLTLRHRWRWGHRDPEKISVGFLVKWWLFIWLGSCLLRRLYL
jgi:hypothetical protein